MTFRTLACLALLLSAAPLFASDWNQWRGPNRDGSALDSPALVDELPDGGLKPIWISEAIPSGKNGGFGSPVVAGGKVYQFAHTRRKLSDDPQERKFPWLPPEKRVGMSDEQYAEYERKRRDEDEALSKQYRFDEVTWCIDAATGETLWKNQRESVYSRWPQSGTAAVVDGRVYVLGAARHARAIDAHTGEDVWTTRLPGAYRDEYMQSSPAVADGAVVFLAGHLFGVDTKTGELLWAGDEKETEGAHSSPVVWENSGKQFVIVNVDGGSTICVEPRTGRELWRVKSEAGNSTPLVAGDRLVTFGSSRQRGMRCYAMTRDGASPLWIYRGVGDPGATPTVWDGRIYVLGEKRLGCVSLEAGKADWLTTLSLSNPRYASPIAAGGKIYFAWEGLLCYEADADGPNELFHAKIDEDGLLADQEYFRRAWNLAELETTAQGQQEAERIWKRRLEKHKPLRCATPAVADGRIYIRLENAVACYDLRAEIAAAGR